MKRLAGLVDHFEQIVLVVLLWRLAAARQIDPHAGCDVLHRFGKCEALGQREEFEDVAAGAAPEAVEQTLVAIDVKRRRLLATKRAETLVALAGELERRDLADEVDDVRRAPYLRDHAVVEVYKCHLKKCLVPSAACRAPPRLLGPPDLR